jgi:hypothetical protein
MYLTFFIVVTVLMVFDEGIAKNEFYLAELNICFQMLCLEVEFFVALERNMFKLFHCHLDSIHSLH